MREMRIYHAQYESLGTSLVEFPINVTVAAGDAQQALTLASLAVKEHGPLVSLKRGGHIFVPGIA